MELYLMRHGIAALRDSKRYPRDEERPLTRLGRDRMRQAAAGLAVLGIGFDRILTSPLLRARQTGEVVGQVLGHRKGVELCPALAPGGSVSTLYEALGRHRSAQRVLLVGHEPDLGELISMLVWGKPEASIPLKKGGTACVQLSQIPPSTGADLLWLLTPKQLRFLARAKG